MDYIFATNTASDSGAMDQDGYIVDDYTVGILMTSSTLFRRQMETANKKAMEVLYTTLGLTLRTKPVFMPTIRYLNELNILQHCFTELRATRNSRANHFSQHLTSLAILHFVPSTPCVNRMNALA